MKEENAGTKPDTLLPYRVGGIALTVLDPVSLVKPKLSNVSICDRLSLSPSHSFLHIGKKQQD